MGRVTLATTFLAAIGAIAVSEAYPAARVVSGWGAKPKPAPPPAAPAPQVAHAPRRKLHDPCYNGNREMQRRARQQARRKK